MSEGNAPVVGESADPTYVAARRILLDALGALAPHGNAVILAGAQAVYLHTGSADIAIAPYTTDGDLALDPSRLKDAPKLEAAMIGAGFRPQMVDGHPEPGIWLASTTAAGEEIVVPVDLIVPEGFAAGGGRRAARLGDHGAKAARRAVGLEAALVDHSTMTIRALEPEDARSFQVQVAGPAALFIAKAHKLHDRVASGRTVRVDDKDAADVVRLMQTSKADEIDATLRALEAHEVAGSPTRSAIGYIEEMFGRRAGPGIEMASRALRTVVPPERVQGLCIGFVAALKAQKK
jgi:hypothetical protein